MAKDRRRLATELEICRSESAASVEIRVHGIGSHVAWSPLGSPGLATRGDGVRPDVALPPRLAGHELRILSWTRTARRRVGVWWYLGLPFAFVNATWAMAPERGGVARAVQAAASWLGALALTFLATIWFIALGETVARRIPAGFASDPVMGRWIAALVGVTLSAIVVRRWTNPNTKTHVGTAVPHLLTIAGTALVAILARPAHLRVGWESSWASGVLTLGPVDVAAWDAAAAADKPYVGARTTYLDPVAAGTAVALGLVAILVAALLVASLVDRFRGRACDSSALAGTALTLSAGTLLLLSVVSALRVATDNLLAYLTPLGAADPPASFDGRGLLPAQYPFGPRDDFIIDLLPLLGIGSAVVLALALGVTHLVARLASVLARRVPSDAASEPTTGGTRVRWSARWRRWVHDIVDGLRGELLPALAIAAVATSVLVWLGLRRVLEGVDRPAWDQLVIAVQLLAVLAAVPLLFPGPRAALAVVTDVLGFWPVRRHPLAGLSYRGPVVDQLSAELSRPRAGRTVVVGHSQGSVIAMWTLAELARKGTNGSAGGLALVTCGSPIDSLYRTFFPAQVTEQVLGHARAITEQVVDDASGITEPGWVNVWRRTDPIATRFPEDWGVADLRLDDPAPPDTKPLAHNDYWIAPEQIDRVALLLGGPSGDEPDCEPVAAAAV